MLEPRDVDFRQELGSQNGCRKPYWEIYKRHMSEPTMAAMCERYSKLENAVGGLCDRIARLPASTPAEVAVKARSAAWSFPEFDDPELDIERADIKMDPWRAEVVRDLIRLQGRAPRAARHANPQIQIRAVEPS
jgi:hypothetical protein